MASTYPSTLCQARDSTRQPVTQNRVDFAVDGSYRLRSLHAVELYRFTINHYNITSAEMASLYSTYVAGRDDTWTLEWEEDSTFYSCIFTQAPERYPVDGGVDGEGIWNVTTHLMGNEQ